MNKTKGISFSKHPGKMRVEGNRRIKGHETLRVANPAAFPHLAFWGKNCYLLSVPDHQHCPVPAALLANRCLCLVMEAGVKEC